MRKIFIMAVLAFALNGTSMAQNQRPQRPRMSQKEMVEAQTKRMAEQLQLSEAQIEAVNRLNEQFFKQPERKLNELRNHNNGGERVMPTEEQRQAMRAKYQEQMAAYKDSLKSILTEDQLKKYENMRTNYQNRQHRGNGQRRR